MIQLKRPVPKVHYYNQDFVDIYVRSWNMIDDCWLKGNDKNHLEPLFFSSPNLGRINQLEACYSTFYLVYSNRQYLAHTGLDNFYSKQEPNGAIRGEYDIETGEVIQMADNPQGILPPLFAWAEYDLYHKVGLKKRVKDILPILQRYHAWLDEVAFDEEVGLYHVPLSATGMPSDARKDTYYPIDFNCQQAMSVYYLSCLGDILNDKEIAYQYKRRYFMLKTKINSLMWDPRTSFYYDLDAQKDQIHTKTLAGYWAVLAEIVSQENLEKLIEYLKDPEFFSTPNPFPTIAANESSFSNKGLGYNGAVYPELTFMVIKGLEKYKQWELAREKAISHLYFILDTFHPEPGKKGNFWQAYLPYKDGAALPPDDYPAYENQSDYIMFTSLATITLMIENIVGMFISLPRKTVDWVVPTLELMGIESLSLKRNTISIIAARTPRGAWELRMESEKLYYFTSHLLGIKKNKTLPIPSGRCSMFLDKL
ncbi:MAG: MGH1-like glycoside hydrolase domain-containing protein [Spirochaetia bacterium]